MKSRQYFTAGLKKVHMEKEYFYLGISENNSFIKVVRIGFGIICFGVAVFWIFYNFNSIQQNFTTWVTIFFISGFGFYQIWSGLGFTRTFIELSPETIRLKKNAFLPLLNMRSVDIEKVQLFPLNMFIFLKSGKKINLRFGTTYPYLIKDVKDAVIDFSVKNSIPLEINEEEF
jgi:hypothetical protein